MARTSEVLGPLRPQRHERSAVPSPQVPARSHSLANALFSYHRARPPRNPPGHQGHELVAPPMRSGSHPQTPRIISAQKRSRRSPPRGAAVVRHLESFTWGRGCPAGRCRHAEAPQRRLVAVAVPAARSGHRELSGEAVLVSDARDRGHEEVASVLGSEASCEQAMRTGSRWRKPVRPCRSRNNATREGRRAALRGAQAAQGVGGLHALDDAALVRSSGATFDDERPEAARVSDDPGAAVGAPRSNVAGRRCRQAEEADALGRESGSRGQAFRAAVSASLAPYRSCAHKPALVERTRRSSSSSGSPSWHHLEAGRTSSQSMRRSFSG